MREIKIGSRVENLSGDMGTVEHMTPGHIITLYFVQYDSGKLGEYLAEYEFRLLGD